MNRLIIIGNGFDLAHGLPTSYSHFIKYIWSNIFKYSKDNDYKYSHLITTSYSDTAQEFYFNHLDKFNTGTLIDFLNNFKSQSGGKYTLIDESDLEILFHNSHISQKKLVFKIKNLFFLHILNKSLNNWVDVEQEYYYLLLKLSNGEMLFNKSFYNINELNEDFKQIKDLLDIYISEEIDMKYLFNSEIKINNSILESFAYNIKYLKDGMDDDYLNEFDPSYKDNLIRFDNKALELYNSSSTAINDLNFENLFLDFNYSKNIENYIKL